MSERESVSSLDDNDRARLGKMLTEDGLEGVLVAVIEIISVRLEEDGTSPVPFLNACWRDAMRSYVESPVVEYDGEPEK